MDVPCLKDCNDDHSLVRIAVFVCIFNAGITTRGMEIVKGLHRLFRQRQEKLQVCFLSWKPVSSQNTYVKQLEDFVRDYGFQLRYYGPPMHQETFEELLRAEQGGTGYPSNFQQHLVSSVREAQDLLRTVFCPDLCLHGIIPDAYITSKLLGIPNILYGPVPLWDRSWVMRCKAAITGDKQAITTIKRPRNIVMEAAVQCGWQAEKHGSLYDATHYLITDLASHWYDFLSPNVTAIGPIFAGSSDIPTADEASPYRLELAHLESTDKTVFMTMGSPGSFKHFVEAMKALSAGQFRAVVAVAPFTIEKISHVLLKEGMSNIPDSIYLTERFVPTRSFASHVDCVVCHGGQGTVQAVMSVGTPILATPLHLEQATNLQNYVVKPHAGICLSDSEWNPTSIASSIRRIFKDSTFKESASAKQKEIEKTALLSSHIAATTIIRVLERVRKKQNNEKRDRAS